MPYCSKCGALLDDDSRFCKKCGSPVGGQIAIQDSAPISPYSQQESIRKETLVEIDRMIEYFDQKQKLYDEYDSCIEDIEYYEDPKTRVTLESTGKVRRILGIIFTIIGFVSTDIAVFIHRVSKDGNVGGIICCATILITGILCLVFGIRASVVFRRAEREGKEELINETEEKLNKITEELIQYYQEYGYCPTGPSYTNPKILRKLRELIYMGRADTIKEAINTMLQDTHNSEMELQASRAAQSAASAARGANTAAFFTAANFFLK